MIIKSLCKTEKGVVICKLHTILMEQVGRTAAEVALACGGEWC